MRGEERRQRAMLMIMEPGERVPREHPLRRVKELADVALVQRAKYYCGRPRGRNVHESSPAKRPNDGTRWRTGGKSKQGGCFNGALKIAYLEVQIQFPPPPSR